MIAVSGGAGLSKLPIVVGVNRGTILSPDIVALSHPLRRIVCFPEYPKKFRISDKVRVEDDDTLESLTAKVHAAEHALLPAVIARLSEEGF